MNKTTAVKTPETIVGTLNMLVINELVIFKGIMTILKVSTNILKNCTVKKPTISNIISHPLLSDIVEKLS
jgi:hypothetical protein